MEGDASKARTLLHKLIEVDKIINTLSNDKGLSQDSLASLSSATRTVQSDVTKGSLNSTSKLNPVLDGSVPRLRHAPEVKKHKSKKPVTKSVVSSDFMKPQSTYCPMCFNPMELGLLRKHMAEECANNEIDCTEVECKARFNADHLKTHLEKECIPARRRKALVVQMRQRKEQQKEELNLLQERAVAEHKRKKAEEERLQRELEDAALAMGVPSRPVSRDKGQSAAGAAMPPSSPEKQQPAKLKEVCEQCLQELPPGANVQQHMSEKCPSRLVYCPNQSGCQKRVPFNLLNDHLAKDCPVEKMKNQLIANAMARCAPVKCIACGKLMMLKELSKHEIQDCVNRKVPCRNAHLGCEVMVRCKDRARHEQVDGKSKTRYCIYTGGEGAHFDLGEDDLRCPWTVEFWMYRPSAREAAKQHIRCMLMEAPLFVDSFIMEHVWRLQMLQLTDALRDASMPQEEREDIMVTLADTVEAFEDAAVNTTEQYTRVGCALAAARGAMTEFLGPGFECILDRRKKETARSQELLLELMCLKRYAPGQVAPVSETRSRPSTQGTSRATSRGGIGSRVGSEFGGSRPSSSIAVGKKKREVIEWSRPETKPADSALGRLLQLVYPEDVEAFTARYQADKEERRQREEERKRLKAAEEEKKRLARERAERGEAEPVTETETETAVVGEGGEGEEKEEGEDKKKEEKEEEEEEDPFAKAMREKEQEALRQQEQEEGPMFELPPPHALLLMGALKDGANIDGGRAQGGTGVLSNEAVTSVLGWLQWIDALELFLSCMQQDLRCLTELRIESGIMREQKGGFMLGTESKDEAEEEAMTATETEEEKEARLKAEAEAAAEAEKAAMKEKEKKRREMKKNRGKKAVMEEIAAESVAAAVDSENGEREEGVAPPTKEELERQYRVAEREARRTSREKLIFRLEDAAKCAAGRDTILFTHTANGRGRRNKICLDMSYLGDDDMQRMGSKSAGGLGGTWLEGRGGGHAGVVQSDGAMGGAAYHSFGKPVPREKWVHVSFVGVKDESKVGGPGSHITMFLDGFAGGSIKGVCFPLPLSSFGGSPALDAWSGCLLDTRIWTKPRSAMEIAGTKNALLKLDGPTEPTMPNYDLTVKGLVGWWTFEDGPKDPDEEQIDDAVEVSEHRPPTVLERSLIQTFETNPDHAALYSTNTISSLIVSLQRSGKYVDAQQLPIEAKQRFWNWENADDVPLPNEKELKAGEDRPLPIPAFSAIGLCPFELKRLRLAQKGRLLHKQVNCTLGCEDFILKKDLRFHVMYLCEMRHAKCRFAPVCGITFPEFERALHEENMCVHLNQRRRLEERFRDLSTPIECDLCGSLVRKRDMEKHLIEKCQHRMVTCPHKDCEEELVAHQLKYHLKFDCGSEAVVMRAILIERSRERLNYPRDWAGTVVEWHKDEPEPESQPEGGEGEGEEGEGGQISLEVKGGDSDGDGGYKTIQDHELLDGGVDEGVDI